MLSSSDAAFSSAEEPAPRSSTSITTSSTSAATAASRSSCSPPLRGRCPEGTEGGAESSSTVVGCSEGGSSPSALPGISPAGGGSRNLPAKTKPHQPMRTKFIPELDLRLRHAVAHAARAAANFRRYVSVRHGETSLAAQHKKRAHGCCRRPSESKAKDQSLLSMRADITSTDMSPE